VWQGGGVSEKPRMRRFGTGGSDGGPGEKNEICHLYQGSQHREGSGGSPIKGAWEPLSKRRTPRTRRGTLISTGVEGGATKLAEKKTDQGGRAREIIGAWESANQSWR